MLVTTEVLNVWGISDERVMICLRVQRSAVRHAWDTFSFEPNAVSLYTEGKTRPRFLGRDFNAEISLRDFSAPRTHFPSNRSNELKH